MKSIVIGIPTFNRQMLLTKLLDSLADEIRSEPAVLRVIVADNECSDRTRAIVTGRHDMPTHYVPVPERGLSHVRNAIIGAACQQVPDWDWLVMLDDDGTVTPGWLQALVGCGERFRADLVGGPVDGMVPDDAPVLAQVSHFAGRESHPTGPIDRLQTTQNLAISRRIEGLLGFPLFDIRFNGSGGEDYDLFRRTQHAGGKLVWCDEALVLEPTPAERLTNHALLSRAYTTGTYMGQLRRLHDGTWHEATGAARGMVSSVAKLGLGLVSLNARRTACASLDVAHAVGRVAGLIGRRTSRYM
ncbi:glycosyltransferase [Sphingomonas sp. CFBP8993]|uniref:glycosyltransferase family 2 protein n=1 Tax=Sphingomonas sp. CFBP8993 TaxID=3096526 RepID=UPI002A69965E|nr:glycosyltransferase [Sphingomonas sp. CFBP8993]MDY0958877.1 glycosyltransferase [Sphingomonas sp. CFBP8993]